MNEHGVGAALLLPLLLQRSRLLGPSPLPSSGCREQAGPGTRNDGRGGRASFVACSPAPSYTLQNTLLASRLLKLHPTQEASPCALSLSLPPSHSHYRSHLSLIQRQLSWLGRLNTCCSLQNWKKKTLVKYPVSFLMANS